MKRIIGALSAAVLVGSFSVFGITSVANAEETTPDPAVTTEATPTVEPSPDITPVDEPTAEPTTDNAPLVSKPDPKPEHKDWVCKYVGTPGVDETLKNGNDGLVWVDSHATQGTWFNDKQGRSFVLLADAPKDPKPDASGCPAPQGPTEVVLPALQITDLCGVDNDKVIIPEVAGITSFDGGQHSTGNPYTWITIATPATGYVIVASPGWTLNEDGTASFISTFTNTSCAPPPPAPQPCVASGGWYTEDIAPVQTPDGWKFVGTNGKAVNWLHPTSGNFQGFTGASYTLSGVNGYQTAYRFVVNPNNGVITYASVTVEPYMNGWAAGQSGKFNITPATLAWSSKIATGPGSQSDPQPLSWFGTFWPNNKFLAQGFHLGSANPPTTYSTVAAVSGCLTASFVQEPEPTPTPTPTQTTTPTPTPAPSETVTPTPSPSAAPVTAVATVATLAETGASGTKWLALGALGLIAIGGVLMLAFARRPVKVRK